MVQRVIDRKEDIHLFYRTWFSNACLAWLVVNKDRHRMDRDAVKDLLNQVFGEDAGGKLPDAPIRCVICGKDVPAENGKEDKK